MSTRTIRTHTPLPSRRSSSRLSPAAQARAYRAATRPSGKRDSPLIPLITILAVAGALTVMFVAGYHFVEPLLGILDNN
jgi:hypothetical protein